MPLAIDLRSLAAFRICFGLYLLWDIYSRLSLGSVDLAWYTSGEATSILDANDTPHKSPFHTVWFFRGSSALQIVLFASTGLLAALFALGHPMCPVWLLWMLVTAQQNRNMQSHDGSDNFCRQLLLWSCFLPMNAVWSVGETRKSRTNGVVSNLPMYGMCTQIVLMYLGTVCHRTVDLYDWKDLQQSEWLLPQLSAVHYALSSGAFAVRDHCINRFIQKHFLVSQIMTFVAMMVELLAPFGCMFGGPVLRWISSSLLVTLHVGLFVSLRLPHWQLLTIITHATIWIPNAAWNRWFPESLKEPKSRPAVHQHRASFPSRALQVFLFAYMMFNFAGERRWIPKLDNGEYVHYATTIACPDLSSSIGEAFRISQYWVMFATVGHTAHAATLKFDDETPMPIGSFPARWERALHQWASTNNRTRIQRFLRALCKLWRPRPREIQWHVSHWNILPPTMRDDTSMKSSIPPSIVTISCEVSGNQERR